MTVFEKKKDNRREHGHIFKLVGIIGVKRLKNNDYFHFWKSLKKKFIKAGLLYASI